MYYSPFYFDSTMLLLIPAMLIAIWAQMKVSSTYAKYSKVRTMGGETGSQIARRILDEAGLFHIRIERTNRELGDHYDPSNDVIRLSPGVHDAQTVAAAGIAAHEVGHAIQHAKGYTPLILRTKIATVVNFGSQISMLLFILGIIFSYPTLTTIGIVFFSGTVVYQIVTLPVEFNASSRALSILKSRGFLHGEEVNGAQKVLNAAAMTYVAAALTSIANLARLILISNRNND